MGATNIGLWKSMYNLLVTKPYSCGTAVHVVPIVSRDGQTDRQT